MALLYRVIETVVTTTLEIFGEIPENPGHSEISEYMLKLTISQHHPMQTLYCIFWLFSVSIIQKCVLHSYFVMKS